MERGGTGRSFDTPCSGADSNAHTVGHPVAERVKIGVHELFTPNELVGSEQMDCSRAAQYGGLRLASTGGG